MSDIPGSADCEARAASVQPVLFATSWAFMLVGFALLWWLWSRRDVSRMWGGLFSAGLVATGIGSVDYHGAVLLPQPLVHDAGLALALLVALGLDLSRLTGHDRCGALAVAALGTVGLVAAIWWPALSPFLAAVVGLGLLVSETLIYRRGLRQWGWTQYAAVTSLLLGVAVFAVSRTGGPLCEPTSLIQGHGLWHVLSAAALGFWALGALPGSARGFDGSVEPASADGEGAGLGAGDGDDLQRRRGQLGRAGASGASAGPIRGEEEHE